MLTQIHRQARDNPIIALATEVREKQVRPALGTYGSSRVLNARDISSADLLASDQLIVGTNRTRTRLNLAVRELLERYDRFPLKGDKLICLRNNRQKGLINGGFWAATADGSIGSHAILLKARSEDFPDLPIMDLRVLKEFFTGGEESITWEDLQGSDAMTYGNAITTHKAQGSQMQRPIVFDESAFFGRDWWRHLYTGITRAIDKVTLVYGKY
jgi:exodeoxyribonuclease-5